MTVIVVHEDSSVIEYDGLAPAPDSHAIRETPEERYARRAGSATPATPA